MANNERSILCWWFSWGYVGGYFFDKEVNLDVILFFFVPFSLSFVSLITFDTLYDCVVRLLKRREK